jgi:hypothetical protein
LRPFADLDRGGEWINGGGSVVHGWYETHYRPRRKVGDFAYAPYE